MRLVIAGLFCLLTLGAVCQTQVRLKTGSIHLSQSLTDTRAVNLPQFGQRKYTFVRFGAPLLRPQQDQLLSQGINFISSVDGAYFLSFPHDLELDRFLIRPDSYGAFNSVLKLSDRLIEETSTADKISVRLLYTGEHNFALLERAMTEAGGQITDLKMQAYNIVTLEINANKIIELADIAPIIWIEHTPAAEEALRYQAVRDERVNVLHGSEYGLTGEGITIGVGDNGKVGDHIDLNGHLTNYASYNVQHHATHVSGIIAGKPNLDPVKGTGVAPNATLVTSFFSNIVTDADRHIRDHDMLITNNSYGSSISSCNLFGDYDLSAVFADAQLNAHDTLTHVFAAGNSGNLTCNPYSARYATILTGWQCAKNTISVGMTNNKDVLSGASSRGPVDDGRLKPEIVAVGNGVTSTRPGNTYAGGGGTSYSSPAITGITALLYEQYTSLFGMRPKAALIKALMLNTADDLGKAGPDYLYGYGRVNARRAAESLNANTFFEGDIAQNDSIILNINVPTGAAELRIMLLWSDPAGAPYASPAITNDLDLKLYDPSEQSYLPWVLNPSPSTVGATAIRGRDSTNNHEQITVDDPQSGVHEILVHGSAIPYGNQHWVLVYEIIMPGITVTHPNGNEPLRPSSADVIRWDAYGDAVGPYHVEYSSDGSTWQTISASVNQSVRYLNWTVPGTFTEDARIRVTSGVYSDSSNHELLVVNAPSEFTATSPCATYAELSWQAVAGADHYRVYQYLGDDMVIIGSSSSTNHIVSELETGVANWFSVAAVTSSGNEGPRAKAESSIPSSIIGCPWPTDIRISEVLNLEDGRTNTSSELGNAHALQVQIVNSGSDTASGFDVGYSLNGGAPVIESFPGDIAPGADIIYTFASTENLSTAGTYDYVIWVTLTGDDFPENDTLERTVIHLLNPPVTLPWIEEFEASEDTALSENTFAFAGLENWDYNVNSSAARLRTRAGSDFILSGSRSITLDETLYNFNAIHDVVATINLSGYDATSDDVRLTFEYMHHQLITENIGEDMVWIRGTDTSLWIPLFDLNTVNSNSGELVALNSGIEVSRAMVSANQNFSSSFQLRFGQEGTASADSPSDEDGYTIDNIELFAVTNDIKLVSLDGPLEAGCGLDEEHIAMRVVNTSANTFDKVALSYSVNGSTPVMEFIIEFAPGADSVFTFDATYNFSAMGEYMIDVWINHADDVFHANDSILGNSIISFSLVNEFPYFEDFETGDGGWFSSGIMNSFELGNPGAAIIHKAASGDRAWVTNADGDYNPNEASFLTSPCFDLSSLSQPMLSFALIQELENNYDFLWVEYSDSGGPWIKLGAVGEGTNWYNDPTEVAWDNVNTRWHVASIDVPVNSSQVQFRFAFISDIGLQLEGAGIDAIHVHEKKSIYSGVSTSPESQVVSGNDWVHFDTPEGRVLSVHSEGQDLGLFDVEMFFHTGSQRDDGEAYVYFRNWVATAAQNPVAPVKVRLYFTEADFTQLANATGCASCQAPKDAFESESFKFAGTIEDSVLTNNLSGAYRYFGIDQRAVLPYDNGYAVEIDVPDFSEFWLTGKRTRTADTLYQKMSSTNDDAEELFTSGGVNPFSDTLDFDAAHLLGLRYPDVSIPQGAFVRDARLIFTPESSQNTSGDITIFGENKDDAALYNTGNYNISLRPDTDLHYSWKPSNWLNEVEVTSPSLRAIVQEIVDRVGWKPGNAIGFSIVGSTGAQAYSYDANPEKAVKLFIIYDSICDIQQRLYVDVDATGDNTGYTWADAITNLQHALDLVSKCEGVSEIWVSEGTYLPALELRNGTFTLQDGVKLYGGFTGVETLLDQRDAEANATILSGDLGLNGMVSDNAVHVITVPGNVDTVMIDGFIIKNGYAFGSSTDDQTGAGIKSSGNILLQNCTIEECSSQLDGSGIFHTGHDQTFILSNCTLRNNSGSAIKNTEAGSVLVSEHNIILDND